MQQMMLVKQWSRLEQLVAVAAAGSLGQAAKQLKVSPSTLSESMRQLESAVGGAALVRTCRGVQLTELGLALVDVVGKMRGALSDRVDFVGIQSGDH